MTDKQSQPSHSFFDPRPASPLAAGSAQNRGDRSAAELVKEFTASGTYRRDQLAPLIQASLSADAAVAQAATATFFAALVEPLADSFEAPAVGLYNRVFAQLIHTCRESARGRELDRALSGLGLRLEADLISRADGLGRVSPLESGRDRGPRIKRIVMLSRVTLGADVAITSVIMSRLKNQFPHADLVLVGGRKAGELFGGDPRLACKEVAYGRTATAAERVLSWMAVLACIRDLVGDLEGDEYLIVDPDSRLTQLGLLPLVAESPLESGASSVLAAQSAAASRASSYLFFPSREYGCDTSRSLAQLTSDWLDEVFGGAETIYPSLSLQRGDLDAAGTQVQRLRGQSARPIVSVNLGVRGHPIT